MALGLLAALSFVASLVAARTLFPLYSLNRDEGVYVAMGRMLQRGEVTLDADEHAAFRPWASAERDGRIVLKYTPPWPAVLASADAATGSMRVGPALAASAATVLVALLAAEVLGDSAVGVLAAALFACSPFVIAQSGTYLPYLFELALGLAFAWLTCTGVRRRCSWRLVAAGVALGVAGFARPWDAVLLGLPFAGALLTAGRGWRRLTGRPVCLVAIGVAPVAVLFLAYNAAVMGSPFEPPYLITGTHDGFGFGLRGVFDRTTIEFGPADGLAGTLLSLRWLASWCFGGVALAAAAAVGAWRQRSRPWSLIGLGATFLVGYLAFWGPYAMTTFWPGAETLGPFYHLPLLVPLVAFAAWQLRRGWLAGGSQRRAAAMVLAAMGVLTAWSSGPKVRANLEVRHDYEAIRDQVAAQELGSALLFLPYRGDLGFESSTPFLENRPDLDQPVLYAEQRGPEDLDLIERHPDRTAYRLSQEREPGSTTAGPVEMSRLWIDRAEEVTVRLRVTLPVGDEPLTAFLHDGADTYQRPLVRAPDGTADISWTLSASGASDPARGRVRLDRAGRAGILALGVAVGSPSEPQLRVERRMPYRIPVAGGPVELLRPGLGFRFPANDGEPRWAEALLGDALFELP